MAKKILIVDDETDFVELLKYRLATNKFDVTVAENGVIALEKARKERPDLILLDIKMPIEDGVSTYEQLKEHDETKDIPVIFITAFPNIAVKERVLKMGARDYITKPYDDDDLLEKVRKAFS
ncbi:MAG: response regulator [Candidatus Omnitrophica bacterium]|nr:response regulator [Candidatus Omnitrophota bacterium]